MRRYDDPVEVRRGLVRGPGRATEAESAQEGPEQFLWRGRLWQVRGVLAHWVETGPWWTTRGAREAIGSDEPGHAASEGAVQLAPLDLLSERELWRVEASRGALDSGGVFDLSFDWSDGRWSLVGCLD